jgi:hypothetical protein
MVGVVLVKGVDIPGYVTLLVTVTALAGVQMVWDSSASCGPYP